MLEVKVSTWFLGKEKSRQVYNLESFDVEKYIGISLGMNKSYTSADIIEKGVDDEWFKVLFFNNNETKTLNNTLSMLIEVLDV